MFRKPKTSDDEGEAPVIEEKKYTKLASEDEQSDVDDAEKLAKKRKKDRKDKHEKKEKKKHRKDKREKKKDKHEKKKARKQEKEKKDHPEDEMVWMEAPTQFSDDAPKNEPTNPHIQRDSWMLKPPVREKKPEPVIEIAKEEVNPALSRELNPYLTGQLHEDEMPEVKVKTVGDGGKGWNRRAGQINMQDSRREERNHSDHHADSSRRTHQNDCDRNDRNYQKRFHSDSRQFDHHHHHHHRQENQPADPKNRYMEISQQEELPEPEQHESVDLNRLRAAMMKAKLRNDTKTYKELENQLKQAEIAKARQPEIRVLTQLDEEGRLVNMPHHQQIQHKESSRDAYKQRSKGRRTEAFSDEHRDIDLKALIAKEKEQGIEDIDRNFARNVLKLGTSYKALEDDELDVSMYESRHGRKYSVDDAEKQRRKAISATNFEQKMLDQCWYCYKGPGMERQKYLVLSLGEKTYLRLPERGRLTPGHVLIVPTDHVSSVTAADEDVVREISKYKASLTRMYKSAGLSPIYLETYLKGKKSSHSVIDAIPLPKEVALDSPIYFQKAIQEAGSEWSQHKKLIKVQERGICAAIPRGFSYFHVDFGDGTGLAHHIEDESKWDRNFGKSVIGGMLGLPSTCWTKPRAIPEEEQRTHAKDFLKLWLTSDFDWTVELDS